MHVERNVLPERDNERVKRLLPLKGAYNFRDMGGLKTKDGGTLKKGLLFRAGQLAGLTLGDLNDLQKLDIHYVFDYRDQDEADMNPDPPIGQAKNERIAVNGSDRLTAHTEWNPKRFYQTFSHEKFLRVYAGMPIENASYKRMMQLIACPEQNLPLIHHCTGGRDRTGVGSMLILMLLDVPTETIMEDYLLSNELLADFHREMFEEASRYLNGPALKRFEKDFLLQEDYLNASMRSIAETYGSFDQYLEKDFGITAEIRERIKNYCLE